MSDELVYLLGAIAVSITLVKVGRRALVHYQSPNPHMRALAFMFAGFLCYLIVGLTSRVLLLIGVSMYVTRFIGLAGAVGGLVCTFLYDHYCTKAEASEKQSKISSSS